MRLHRRSLAGGLESTDREQTIEGSTYVPRNKGQEGELHSLNTWNKLNAIGCCYSPSLSRERTRPVR